MKVKIRKILLVSLFSSGFALAQSYDPATGQGFDAYGRPLASVEQLCREGQMAGGPITEKCLIHGYRFNKNGEQLVNYNFTKWGYNLLDRTITKKMAVKLDADPKFRAEYIKSHHMQPFVRDVKSDDDVIGLRDDKQFRLNSEYRYIMRCQRYLDPATQKNAAQEVALSKTGQSTLVNNDTCSIWDGAKTNFSLTVTGRSGLMIQATLNYPDNASVHPIGYFFISDLVPVDEASAVNK